jgi:hypothetical protein
VHHTSSALDEALDRMAMTDFELPNGFVNHGPMACEALAVLGCDDQIDGWARWFVQLVGEGPRPVEPTAAVVFEWSDALGDYRRLPEWVGYFARAIADDGWDNVVELWVPRLVPGMVTTLFHGVIRTAHAVRAIDAIDTAPRRAELARALGYWAARYRPGQPISEIESSDHVEGTLMALSTGGARHYATSPSIFHLHGVTGAMAVELLLGHMDPGAAARAVAQVEAEYGVLYPEPDPTVWENGGIGWDAGWAATAAVSGDAHQVKLVEACRRGFDMTADVWFAVAARQVTASH